MIDAKAGDLALAHEAQDELVRDVEDLRHLHPHRGEVVHVEEAAVVDLVARDAPVGEPVRLGGQEPVEEVEARGIAFRPVHDPEIVVDVLADLRRLLDEGGEPALDDLLLAQALRDPRGIGLRPAGQVVERGEDAAQLAQARVLGAEPVRDGVEAMREDLRIRVRAQRQARPGVAHEERALGQLDAELSRLEHAAVLVGQDGQQHLVGQLALHGMPVDVEERGPRRAGAVLEHVEPPRVGVARDAHVIGDDVEDEAEAMRGQRRGHPVEGRLAADLRIEGIVVGDVVAVRAAGPALEARREVGVAHAEGGEIRGEIGHGLEAEPGPELQAVRGVARPRQGRAHLLEQDTGVDHEGRRAGALRGA